MHCCIAYPFIRTLSHGLHSHRFIVQAVNNFRNETGYTKRIRKAAAQSSAPAAQPQPRVQRPVQPLKLLNSRQQDPLRAHTPPQNPPAAVAPPPAVTPPVAVTQQTSMTVPEVDVLPVSRNTSGPPAVALSPPQQPKQDDAVMPK